MPRLAIALVFAKDADRLARFYEAGFGFAVVQSQPGWIVLDAGGVELGVHQIPPEYAASIEIGDPPRARRSGTTKLCFDVDDFAAAKARLEAAGAHFDEPKPWDGDVARDGVDLEGNVFRIQERGS